MRRVTQNSGSRRKSCRAAGAGARGKRMWALSPVPQGRRAPQREEGAIAHESAPRPMRPVVLLLAPSRREGVRGAWPAPLGAIRDRDQIAHRRRSAPRADFFACLLRPRALCFCPMRPTCRTSRQAGAAWAASPRRASLPRNAAIRGPAPFGQRRPDAPHWAGMKGKYHGSWGRGFLLTCPRTEGMNAGLVPL
jgi:hypothetical protein